MKHLAILFVVLFLSLSCHADSSSVPIPAWLQTKIENFNSTPPKNPPVEIVRMSYKGETVYYISSYCCDVASELYTDSGTLLCMPDGGLSGNGDGRCPDLFNDRRAGTVIWRDARTQP